MIGMSGKPTTLELRWRRRAFLRLALAGSVPLALTGRADAARSFGRARRCILVFLSGGPSQIDLWDMKPDAPTEIRGELAPIATNVAGIQVGELLPLTARQVDKFKIVRSVTHEATVHTTAMRTMLTGTEHPTPTVDQTRARPDDPPHLGSILAARAGGHASLPLFVALPRLFEAPPVDGIWPGQNAGFLGRRHDPFVIAGDVAKASFRLPTLDLPADVSAARVLARRMLLGRLEETTQALASSRRTFDLDACRDQALALVDSPRLCRAADLDREPARTRERYGNHIFGQGLLLARRLVETGVPLVTVYWIDPTPPGPGGGEFDSHGRIYFHMRERLMPPADRGLAALFEDLSERGLLADTLIVVMGEFGRSPRINRDAGRDHWPAAQSILLAGAGISGGTILGATDAHASVPVSCPISPPDLGQSLLHLLGVPSELELADHLGRPIPASRGRVIEELFA